MARNMEIGLVLMWLLLHVSSGRFVIGLKMKEKHIHRQNMEK